MSNCWLLTLTTMCMKRKLSLTEPRFSLQNDLFTFRSLFRLMIGVVSFVYKLNRTKQKKTSRDIRKTIKLKFLIFFGNRKHRRFQQV